MGNRDVLAIGASAGGVEALVFLVKRFPANFPASVLITLHMSSDFESSLDELLSKVGPLTATFASDYHRLRKGEIYIAPPNKHLLLDGDHLQLGNGPRENNSRPAIDPMLRSVALCCGGRAVGVILTGTLGDGASGLWAVSQCNGITVVQDPNDALFSEMPETALNRITPDHLVPLAQMPNLFNSLANETAVENLIVPDSIKAEVEIARNGGLPMDNMDKLGVRSTLTCPECHGVMWAIREDDLLRYRCHVGHTYTAELMSVALDQNIRTALASAQRALEERLALARKLHSDASQRGQPSIAKMWLERVNEYDRELTVLKNAIQRMEDVSAKARLDAPDIQPEDLEQ